MMIICQDLFVVFFGLQLGGWDDKLNNHQQRVSTDCGCLIQCHLCILKIELDQELVLEVLTLQGEDCL